MAALKNSRNILLSGAASRVLNAGLVLTSGGVGAINVPLNSSTPTPSSITITATTAAYSNPTYVWEFRYGTSGTWTSIVNTTNTLTVTLDAAWLTAAANNQAVQYRVTVTQTGFNTSQEILSLPIIRPTKSVEITGQANFKVNLSGVYSPTNATLTAVAQNFTSPTYSWTVTNATPTSGTGSSITITPNASVQNISVSVTVTEPSTNQTATRSVTLSVAYDGANGANGAAGAPAVRIDISKAAATVIAFANGTVNSWAEASGQLKLYSGSTDVTAAATLSVTQNNLTGTINTADNTPVNGQPKGYYQVTAMPGDTGNLVLTAVYNGVTYTATFSVSKLKVGFEIVATLPTTDLFEGRMVFLTSDDKLYRYTGSAWTAAVPATDITGQVVAAQIADAAINVAKFASGIEPVTTVASVPTTKSTNSIFNTTDGKLYRWNGTAYIATVPSGDISGTLADAQIAAVSAAKVTGQLTNSQLADIAAAKITGQLTDAQIAAIAATKLTGQITTTQITDGAISTAKISAGAVTAGTIAAGAVTAGKIAADAVTATEIAAGSITSGKIAAGAVTAGKVAADTITASEIAAGSITTAKIAAGAVTAGTIAAGTITGDKISANTISGSNIAADTITAGNIAAGAVSTSELAAGAVNADKIAANAITSDKIAANAITAGKISAGTITAAEIASNAITSDKILAGSITAAKIATNTITAAQIAAGTITANEIATNAITVDKITSGTTSTINGGTFALGGSTQAIGLGAVIAARRNSTDGWGIIGLNDAAGVGGAGMVGGAVSTNAAGVVGANAADTNYNQLRTLGAVGWSSSGLLGRYLRVDGSGNPYSNNNADTPRCQGDIGLFDQSGLFKWYGNTGSTILRGVSLANANYAVEVTVGDTYLKTSWVDGNCRISTSLGVGTTASGNAGEIRATGNIIAYFSDDRLKTNLGTIENALYKVKQLVGFHYKPNELAQRLGYEVTAEVGVSAQQVQKVLPEAVATAPINDQFLTVKYERLAPLLIEAIKELDIKLTELKEAFDAYTNRTDRAE